MPTQDWYLVTALTASRWDKRASHLLQAQLELAHNCASSCAQLQALGPPPHREVAPVVVV